MKKSQLVILLLIIVSTAYSQQVSRYVVSSGGNYSTVSGISLSSTIGEPMITTLETASLILTQGFQQPGIESPTIVIDNPLNGTDFTTSNNVTINYTVSNFSVGFPGSSADGHIHYFLNGAITMLYNSNPIQLNSLANGSYTMILQLVDNNHIALSPIISDTVAFTVGVIPGCMDSTQFNYNPLATVDDGSCLPINS